MVTNSDPNPNGFEEISIRDLVLKIRRSIRFLTSKWALILILSGAFAIVGGVYAIFTKPLYTAEVTFVIEGENTGKLSGYSSIVGQLGLNLSNGSSGVFSGQNLISLMRSRTIVERALLSPVLKDGKETTLAEIFIEMKGLRKDAEEDEKIRTVFFRPGSDSSSLTREQSGIISSLYSIIIKDYLRIGSSADNASINSLKIISEDEYFSLKFNDVLLKIVSDFYISTKTKKAAQNLAILQHQTDSVKRAFNSAVSGVAFSSEGNPNPNPAMQRLKVPSQRRQVDVTINQAILSELVKNLEVAKVSLRNETPLIQVIDRPVLPLAVDRKSPILFSLYWGASAFLVVSLILMVRRFYNELMIDE